MLRVAILLNSRGYCLISIMFLFKYTLFEYFFKRRSVGKPYIPALQEMPGFVMAFVPH